MSNGLHVQPSGTVSKPTTPSAIKAHGQARTIIGGIVLVILTIAYVAALFWKVEGASALLAVVATGLGYLFGSSRSRGAGDD